MRAHWGIRTLLYSFALAVFILAIFARKITGAPNVNDSFEFIELERSFLVGTNYLLDGVHLSEEGHRRIAEIVGAKVSP